MSSCDNSNIKKNYIVTGIEQDILSACTSFYTNEINSCSGNTINVNSSILNADNINLSGQLTVCEGIYTSNLYGCSPITIHDDLVVSGSTTLQSLMTTNIKITDTPQIDDNLILQLLTLDDSTDEVKIKPIPNTINYGVFSQTGDSLTVSATTTESSILGEGIGTLTIPANSFSIGDSFRCVLCGVLSNGNNQTLRIKIKSGSLVLSDSGIQTLVSHTDDIFKLENVFTIRNIGSPSISSIITIGSFQTVKKNSSSITGFGFETINNTTFDTTIPNTLDITVQWGTTNNSIKSQIFTLTKTY